MSGDLGVQSMGEFIDLGNFHHDSHGQSVFCEGEGHLVGIYNTIL